MKIHQLIRGLSYGLGLLLLSNCTTNEVVIPEKSDNAKYYKSWEALAEAPLSVESNRHQVDIRAISEEKWQLYFDQDSDSSWCQVIPNEGSAYSKLMLKIEANPRDKERETVINCFFPHAEKEMIPIVIKQKASDPTLESDTEALNMAVIAKDYKIELSSNTDWTAQIVPFNEGEDVSWASIDITSGEGDQTITVSSKLNISGAERKAKLVINSVLDPVTIELTQLHKFETPIVNVNDGKELILTWEAIAGVDGYEIVALDANDVEVGTKKIEATATSFDMTSFTYANNYVGMVKIFVKAFAESGETSISTSSTAVSVHSHFSDQSGDGTAGSEYIISEVRHLNNVRLFLNAHYKQVADIDLTEVAFAPISESFDATLKQFVGEFTGVYDAGKGDILNSSTGLTSDSYEISNFQIAKVDNAYVGLFARIGEDGMVRNITMTNSQISALSRIGAIAGQNNGTIVGCTTNGGSMLANSTSNSSPVHTGGIVGYNTGNVYYCKNNMPINADFKKGNFIGGVVGTCNGADITIEGCSNSAPIMGNSFVSGIVARCESPDGSTSVTITKCYNTGVIESGVGGNVFCSGIMAGSDKTDLTINRCYNTANIKGGGSIGGILGRSFGACDFVTISNCYNSGSISNEAGNSNGNNGAAGIMAASFNPATVPVTITNCYNRGAIASKGMAEFRRDGLVTFSKNGEFTLGGCISLNTDASNQSRSENISGTPADGKTFAFKNADEAAMQSQATYEGWDFSNTWTMGADGYPHLIGLEF